MVLFLIPLAVVGAGIAASMLAPKVAEAVVSHPSSPLQHPTIKKARKDKMFMDAVAYAENKQSKGQSDDPWYQQMFYALPGSRNIYTGEAMKYIKEYYNNQGITDPQRIKIAQKAYEVKRNTGGIWEAAAAVSLSAGAETIGTAATSKLVSKQLAKRGIQLGSKQIGKQIGKQGLRAGLKEATKQLSKKEAASIITKAAVLGIAPAGFFEGASTDIMQQYYRKNKVDPKQTVVSGLLGAGSATLLGVPIARTAITKPKGSKVLQAIGYGLDPYEWPGDVLAEVPKRGLKIQGVKIPIRTQAFTSFPTLSLSKTEKARAKAAGLTQDEMLDLKMMNRIMTQTPSQQPSTVPTNVFTPTYAPTTTPSDITTPADTETPTEPPTEPPTETPTDTMTNTMTETPTFTNVPTMTPLPRLMPPMPFIPASGQAGRGSGKVFGRGSVFYDEPSAAAAVLRGLL